MATPEGNYRTPENDEELLAKLEHINADENPINREHKLDTFYEETEGLEKRDNDEVKQCNTQKILK